MGYIKTEDELDGGELDDCDESEDGNGTVLAGSAGPVEVVSFAIEWVVGDFGEASCP